ncbi:MAG TPA: hypothetical protein VG897_16850, partial [Terriglobales bacterium]|nr:hypothetical protein [Terriglobales bacterium]
QDAEFDMREMSEKTGGGWLPIGSERGLDRNRYFELSDKERGAIQAFGKYIAERVLKPYLLQLDLSPQASGKLKLQIIDNSGMRDKKLEVVAPDRLLELVP